MMVLGGLAVLWVIGGIKHRKETNQDRILPGEYIFIFVVGVLAIFVGLVGFLIAGL